MFADSIKRGARELARQLYYGIPVGLRQAARRAYYLPVDLLRPLPDGAPPRGMIYTGGDGEHFIRQRREIVTLLRRAGALSLDSDVLDIGSGIGKVALPLREAGLRGRYLGFDIIQAGVRWCREHISRPHPNFEFVHTALANDLYAGVGGDATDYRFPCGDDEFDLALANSVFTHLLSEEVAHYIAETRRALRPGYGSASAIRTTTRRSIETTRIA